GTATYTDTENAMKRIIFISFLLMLALIVYWGSNSVLPAIGKALIVHPSPVPSQAAVVLNTDQEYYSRLLEAAQLYRAGLVKTIILNGNRKTEILKQIEADGFTPACVWYEDYLRILSLYGVDEDDVICISAEDVYDTVTEAETMGPQILSRGIDRILLITSKFHTRRAGFIWNRMFRDQLQIQIIGARTDPFDPDHWWQSGRQVRWVLAEYGAWLYYGWKQLTQTGS
ncbi:MAG TPA: YdcF family protein, partial [Desulfatirhabdiaceae bacterium]|nr:YdcF family protein [Desulfatirhabdiaceae bacterium]